jgi:hypothetical protein
MTIRENSIQKDIGILGLMVLKITKYFDKYVYIGDLIYDLENYLSQLTTVNKQWKQHFRTLWLDVEVAYSLALDQGLEILTDEGNVIADNSLNILKKMAEDKKNELEAARKTTGCQ